MEYQMIRRLVNMRRPRMPGLPLVSSINCIESSTFSPPPRQWWLKGESLSD